MLVVVFIKLASPLRTLLPDNPFAAVMALLFVVILLAPILVLDALLVVILVLAALPAIILLVAPLGAALGVPALLNPLPLLAGKPVLRALPTPNCTQEKDKRTSH